VTHLDSLGAGPPGASRAWAEASGRRASRWHGRDAEVIPRITGVAPHTLQSFVRERFPALGRVRARSFLYDGCPEAMSWFVVLLKTTEMEE
jgi:hypothetical protein